MSAPTLQVIPGTPSLVCLRQDEAVELRPIARQIAADHPVMVWLDSARVHPVTGRFSLLGWDPWCTLTAHEQAIALTTAQGDERLEGHPLVVLRQLLRRYPGPTEQVGLPPVGLGWFTFFSYELNRWIERLPIPKVAEPAVPLVLVLGMRMIGVVDHWEGRTWWMSVVDPHQPAGRALEEAHERLQQLDAWLHAPTPAALSEPPSTGLRTTITPGLSQRHFETMVATAQTHIRAGDIFQANLSQQFSATWAGSPWTLYEALRQINPSPFACLLQHPACTLVSCSPERLVSVRQGIVETRPIAGTRPRGNRPAEDVVNRLELLLSEKERAEHIMLVDLARNDVGRVCRHGSVRADELMIVEDYSHVMHIVSNVRGVLRQEADAVDVIRAMFPGGTITGCPKVRCMEIIHELEPVGRGAYTGSLGYLGFDGSMDLNILIRTMALEGPRVWFHAGAGIVADSQPDREYHETVAKAQALMSALTRGGLAHEVRDAVAA